MRLDGIDPTDPDAPVPAPAGITAVDLDDAIHHAVAHTTFRTPAHPDNPAGWRIAWGNQVLVKHITMRGRDQITDEMVAGYLAKYATKSTEATGFRSTRITQETIGELADPNGDHIARLIHACWQLGRRIYLPTPLNARRDTDQVAHDLRSTWTCTGCGKATRLATCPHCADPTGSAPVDPAPVDTYVSKPGPDDPYTGLRRWAHMLGFGGHFLTKARRYSLTFKILREARAAWRRATDETQDPGAIAAVDHLDEETTLIVGGLTYAGTGWRTTGDALLANTAAAKAREYAAVAREEIAHEIGIQVNEENQSAA
jgi:hypothetical protein